MTTPRSSHESAEPEPTRIRFADMTWRDYVRIGLGVFFFLLGIAGLVLPILQGVLFLIISAILLAPYSIWVQKQLRRFERRFPWVAEQARAVAARWNPGKRG